MQTAQLIIKDAVQNSIQCQKDYGGPAENYLIGSLRSKMADLFNRIERITTDKNRVAWVLIEGLLDDHSNNLTEEEQDCVADLLGDLREIMGGPDSIHLSYEQYKRHPESIMNDREGF